MGYTYPVPAHAYRGTVEPNALVAWIDAVPMTGIAGADPLEIAMVVCAGPDLHEVAAITLPVDHERQPVQEWFTSLPTKQQQRHKRSGLMQEVLSNGLMMPMVMDALAQTLDRLSEPGGIVLAAEDPSEVRRILRPLTKGFQPPTRDLSLAAMREWGAFASVDCPEVTDWGTVPKPFRALDHCLGLVDEARQYLVLLKGDEA